MRTADRKHQGSRGDPTVATLLTWFAPGAGHLYLGQTNFAILAFMVIEGLFLLGVKLSDGLLFEFLQADLRTTFAPILTPEAGNLGALIMQRRTYGYVAPSMAQPWPDTIKLGAMITALSGVLNLCLMVRANVDARLARKQEQKQQPAGPSPATAVLFGFLVPGLGHWFLGRKLRGTLIFVALVGLFLVGTFLGEGANLDRERHFYYWGGQFLLGLPAMVTELVHGHPLITRDIRYVDAGLVFGSVAGLLNILAMTDAYACAERKLAGGGDANAGTAQQADGDEVEAGVDSGPETGEART
jgi:TM2 domain-containing membrane protein YozV